VSPELAGCADTGLYFIDYQEDVVFASDFTGALEEGGGGMVVAAVGLDTSGY